MGTIAGTPDIPPILWVDPGEEVVLETRDASDGQIKPGMTAADLEHLSMESRLAICPEQSRTPFLGVVHVKRYWCHDVPSNVTVQIQH